MGEAISDFPRSLYKKLLVAVYLNLKFQNRAGNECSPNREAVQASAIAIYKNPLAKQADFCKLGYPSGASHSATRSAQHRLIFEISCYNTVWQEA